MPPDAADNIDDPLLKEQELPQATLVISQPYCKGVEGNNNGGDDGDDNDSDGDEKKDNRHVDTPADRAREILIHAPMFRSTNPEEPVLYLGQCLMRTAGIHIPESKK